MKKSQLGKAGLEHYKKIENIMEQEGRLITSQDELSITQACIAYEIIVKAHDNMKINGVTFEANGMIKSNPAMTVLSQGMSSYNTSLINLLLTAKSAKDLKNQTKEEGLSSFL